MVARLEAGEVLRYRDYKDILRRHRDGSAYLEEIEEEDELIVVPSAQAGPDWQPARFPRW
jgi:hypothetical protein